MIKNNRNVKTNKQKVSHTLSVAGLISSLISLLAFVTNVNNWANIARESSYSGGSGGGVGFDVPLIYPIVISLLLILLSYLVNRQRLTSVQLISLTILLSIITIWGLAMGFDKMNPYQSFVS